MSLQEAATTPLDQGRLRRRLSSGEVTFGTFIGNASAVSAEVCAASGVDWIVLDLEHGAAGEEEVRHVIPVAAAYGVPTVVRVESPARIRLGRVLDLGAAGVMLPRMDTPEEVSEAVRHLRYPPSGDRGVATSTRATRFGLDIGALAHADEGVLTVVQIESARAVQNVDDIAAIPGVDVLFVGPRDLTHDLGVPGDIRAPVFLEHVERVRAAAKRHGKVLGIMTGDGAAAAARRIEGFTFIAIGSDALILAAGVAAAMRQGRGET